jgi:hypothetical protein
MSGDPSQLENFNDAQHGYLRMTVTDKHMTLDYVAVPGPSTNPKDAYLPPFDSVTVTFRGFEGVSSKHRQWILDCPVKPGNDTGKTDVAEKALITVAAPRLASGG